MGNIRNFNFNKIDLKLSNSDYWDLFLTSDECDDCYGTRPSYGDCLVVWYDFNNPATFAHNQMSAVTINSLVTWDQATNSGYTFDTIGLTGIDNGLITFNKLSGDTSNLALLNALTGSTLLIPSGDTRFQMTKVSGSTNQFIYPIDIITGGTSTYAQFCGGFYQGYYKIDGYDYQVLPTRVNHAWAAEFWLNPQDICNYTGTTLNDIYPNNKGFFFYMGTRAENKFWNIWEGADSGCTSGCTVSSGCTGTTSQWCTVPKESELSIIGDYGVAIPLDPPQVEIDLITNPFLIYGRGNDDRYGLLTGNSGTILLSSSAPHTSNSYQICGVCGEVHDGLGSQTACSYDGNGIVVVKTSEKLTNKQNPFLVYGRGSGIIASGDTCCGGPNDGLGGETVKSFSGFSSPITQLDYNVDVIDNALGFRIKDNGSIGYRLLTYTGACVTNMDGSSSYVSGVTIEEKYSDTNIVKPDEWQYVVIRFVTEYKDDCELKIAKPRKGKLMFYVNAKLKFVVDEFDEFVARRLSEYKDKQIGVPFNFSIGGGSQGLIESQTFGGLDIHDRGLPIEHNFAGTFIGGIEQFKFSICDLNYNDIQNIYNLGLSGQTVLPKAPSGYYHGKISTSFITLNDIVGLTFTLGNEIINNYTTFSSNTNSYGYVLVPSDFTQPSNFKNSHAGCQGFSVPYIELPSINILDANGYSVNYIVYRTYNKTHGLLDIWYCS